MNAKIVLIFLLALIGTGLIGGSVAQANQIPPWERVIGVEIADFNGDGGVDKAVLVKSESEDGPQADLFIYLASFDEKSNESQLELALIKPDAAWLGLAWGTMPSLEISDTGSLLIRSENEAIGRNRWNQSLTVAYRKGQFLVVGYTFNSRDTVEPNAGTSCDINLATGQGVVNGEKVTVPERSVPLIDWTEQNIPAVCRP